MVDLRTIQTTARITQAERMEAQMRHTVARNDAERKRAKEYNAHRGLTPMAIGQHYLPASVARAYLHVKVA
jgi:excinuclease UvrABC helicase subunit UvrB